MKKNYSGWFGDVTLDLDIDFYGYDYWNRVFTKTYEPDTMVFLENNLGPKVDFIDVGAATGAMSIIASTLGSRVLSFEAVPKVFEIAKKHLANNPRILERVQLQNKAISNSPGILELGVNANPNVLSSISDLDPTSNSNQPVEIVSLSQAITGFHNRDHRLVLKIDIEGAEWKLLSDENVCETLADHEALVLLAIHPGFNRPFQELPLGLTILTKKVWQIQNLFVALNFFTRLMKHARVTRTSLDVVSSPKKCVLLMFGGYFEFVLDFKVNS
jgi:FkbM family methyltransferase